MMEMLGGRFESDAWSWSVKVDDDRWLRVVASGRVKLVPWLGSAGVTADSRYKEWQCVGVQETMGHVDGD
ncbi:hypothetical protein V6N12_024429 [Hibiscus sabdariffa]|uniref:Uncharacterized protein n=1 Tax=Hibiscus sabdariffa TaxID=183260 RepID=A0ABR2G0M4_9ROSI